MRTSTAAEEIQGVLSRLEEALIDQDIDRVLDLFSDDCYWRDLVSFTWNFTTSEGKSQIRDMLESCLETVQPRGWALEDWPVPHRADAVPQGFIRFGTSVAHGYGYIRLRDGSIQTLLTTMEDIKGHEEIGRLSRPRGLVEGDQVGDPTWTERRESEIQDLGTTHQPYVLVVGGGHAGIILGARLRHYGVPALIVDKNDRPGDNWRKRYSTLQLHNPVWENHLPYIPFPDSWPVYMNKDKFADWLESYTRMMELNYWGSSSVRSARYDEGRKSWDVEVQRSGATITLHPEHLVIATGAQGRPVLPTLPGQDVFAGVQEHSSEHEGPDAFRGKKVVVVGSGTSAHDIAAALATRDVDVTMIQRSPTYVVKPDSFNEHVLGPLYSQEAVDRGITAERGDILSASIPFAQFFDVQKAAVDAIREADADYYSALERTGYLLDFGPRGAGLFARALTGVNNYYVDVGAMQMIIDGRIRVASGSGVNRLTETSVVLDDGREFEADAVVYATGFSSMEGTAAELISQDLADSIGPVWGIGSGEPKDPGPWEGEIRNMWKPVAHEALWFHGSLIAHARSFSKYLALQLKARMEGIPTPVYGSETANRSAVDVSA